MLNSYEVAREDRNRRFVKKRRRKWVSQSGTKYEIRRRGMGIEGWK